MSYRFLFWFDWIRYFIVFRESETELYHKIVKLSIGVHKIQCSDSILKKGELRRVNVKLFNLPKPTY